VKKLIFGIFLLLALGIWVLAHREVDSSSKQGVSIHFLEQTNYAVGVSMAFFSLTNGGKDLIAAGTFVQTLNASGWVGLPGPEKRVWVDGKPAPLFLSATNGVILQVAPPLGFEPWRIKIVFFALPSNPSSLTEKGRRFLHRFGLRFQRGSTIFGPKMLPNPSPLTLQQAAFNRASSP
jgi:hypothetical protein